MTGTSVDIEYWSAEAARTREEAGGYTFESLAVTMILKVGWSEAASIAGALEPYVQSFGWKNEREMAAAPLFEVLGWEQSALLLAWFNNLENYREVRDTFPATAVPR